MAKRFLIAGLIFLAGCGSSKSDPAQPPPVPPSLQREVPRGNMPSINPAQPNINPSSSAGKTNDQTAAKPNIPANARYTVFAGRVEGDLHVARADRLKSELMDVTRMKDWYVVHEDQQSVLYYGYYSRIDDPKKNKESYRAQLDCAKIKMMTDPMGDRPFQQAILVQLTAPDPAAPPEWNLANAPGDVSLQIGVYMDSPQRKQAAVEAVKAARAQGIEAYYFHGPTQSLVCVGHWPASAYQATGNDVKSSNPNPDQVLMVGPNVQDDTYQKSMETAAAKPNVQVVQTHFTILDPTLRDAMTRFPHNSINGMETKRMVRGSSVFDDSQLVPIPHDKAPAPQVAGAAEAPGNSYDPSYRPNIPSQTSLHGNEAPVLAAPTNNGGKLRSIGDQ